jgi:hypothetical protein
VSNHELSPCDALLVIARRWHVEGLLSSSADSPRKVLNPWSLRRPLMTIVVGLDQHRAQITTEWIDTATGEIGRARVTHAHRDGVRRFPARFAGQELEVALEATTGWGSLLSSCAGVHLGEPAATSALRGNKKRPKSDRADATARRV